MRAHEVSFLDLVQGEKQFQVPLYQRTYSWGGKQLAQLWRDLLAQSEAMADGSPAGTHFMGSVVITPSPTLQAAGVNRWLLVLQPHHETFDSAFVVEPLGAGLVAAAPV